MRRWLLALLIAAPAAVRAQEFRAAAPEIFPRASEAWTAAIGGALARSGGSALPSALQPLASPSLTPTAAFAPIAAHLETSLGIQPAAFAALPPAQQHAALDLAVEEARNELQSKTFELGAQSHTLTSPDRTLDKDGRAELFLVVAHLQELHTRYAPLLDESSRALVAEAYERSLLRAVQVRDELIRSNAEGLAGAVGGEGRDAAPPAETAADPALLPVSRRTLELYAQMSETTAGWGADDVDTLLTGFGFSRRDSKHRNYSHPHFPTLHDSYSHTRRLKDIYVKSALRMVRELARLRAAAAPDAAAEPGDLAHVRLEDLTALLSAEKTASSAAESTTPDGAADDARTASPTRMPKQKRIKPVPILVASSRPADARPAFALAPASPLPDSTIAEPPAPEPKAGGDDDGSTLSRVTGWLRSALLRD
jgi:hypothetical protein